MATILKTVGGNIRRIRKSRRLTLEQLAEKSESNPKYLGAVERGEENIGLNKLAQVAAALRLKLHVVHASSERDFAAIFTSLTQLGAGALVVCTDNVFTSRGGELGALVLRHRVPAEQLYLSLVLPLQRSWVVVKTGK